MANETAAPQTERRTVAWIGPGVRVEGRLTSSEDLVIDGRVDGSIDVSDHHLSIGADGAVTAHLMARRITISGSVTGNVTARERVDLHASGSVTGDITAPRFVMAEGATVAGKVDAGAARATGKGDSGAARATP
jgi:cytoskeletal protein CcmA (bactofilin family)